MSSKLYKLALWYIKKCNSKCTIQYKEKVESLPRLTYKTSDKYMLLYGADAEWKIFNKYDVLNNAIQKLAEYENIGTVKELKTLKENPCKRKDYVNIKQQDIDEFIDKICEKYAKKRNRW